MIESPDQTSVAVVIVNYRTPDMALAAARAVAVERARLPRLRLVIVDGGSADGSAERIAAGLADPLFDGWASTLPQAINGGFGWANNQAILRLLQGDTPPDHIYLLNPDTVIEPGAIARLATVMRDHPRAGAVGSQIVDASDKRQPSEFLFPSPRTELVRGARTGLITRLAGTSEGGKPFVDTLVEADWTTGACTLLRADALRGAGVFDDGFFLYFEEVELMWRMRARGWTVLHEPASRVLHIGGAATGVTGERKQLPDYWYASQRRFFALTGGRKRAVAASAAWCGGHLIWRARAAVTGRGDRDPRAGRSRLRFAWPAAADIIRADTRWTRAPGQPPLWMTGR